MLTVIFSNPGFISLINAKNANGNEININKITNVEIPPTNK